MKNFEFSESSNENSNNNEQKGQRKRPRFSPIAYADQPSTSAVHEFKREDKGRIIPGLLEWLGTPEEKRKLMAALTQQDHLRSFLRYSKSELTEWEREKTKRIAKEISAEAAKIGIGVEEYFDLITCYYRADAGSYTTDAGCRFGFNDFLFEKETAPNRTRAFSEQTQEYYDILAEAVKSIASNTEI